MKLLAASNLQAASPSAYLKARGHSGYLKPVRLGFILKRPRRILAAGRLRCRDAAVPDGIAAEMKLLAARPAAGGKPVGLLESLRSFRLLQALFALRIYVEKFASYLSL